jgi:hypothetical protein
LIRSVISTFRLLLLEFQRLHSLALIGSLVPRVSLRIHRHVMSDV